MRFPSLACGLLLAASVSAQSPTFSGQVYGPHFGLSADAIQIGDFNGRPALMVATLNSFPEITWLNSPAEPAMYPGIELKLQHIHVFETAPEAMGVPFEIYDDLGGTFYRNTSYLLTIQQPGWNPPLDPSWPVNPLPRDLTPSPLNSHVEWRFQYTNPNGFPGQQLAEWPEILFAVFDVRVL